MTEAKQKEADQLHMELERLVLKLKHNREKVPLDVLKTKYAAGYTALSQKICRAASDYAKMVTIDGIPDLSGVCRRRHYPDQRYHCRILHLKGAFQIPVPADGYRPV